MKTKIDLIPKIACSTVLPLLLGACAATTTETRITRAIEERVADMRIGRHDITIDEANGNVRLAGEVGSETARDMIEEAALEIDGVDSVRNDIVVISYAGRSGTATPLTEAVEARILRDAELENFRIEVSEAGGDIVLSGWAETPEEADRVGVLASGVPGVRRVFNRIQYTEPESDQELAARVKRVLSSEPGIDMRGVEVTARNGVVTFHGSKAGHREIDRILANALMVSGVKDVSSEMTIAGRAYSTADAFHAPGERPETGRARYRQEQDR